MHAGLAVKKVLRESMHAGVATAKASFLALHMVMPTLEMLQAFRKAVMRRVGAGKTRQEYGYQRRRADEMPALLGIVFREPL
jgi:hypothetical protein